MRTAMVIGAVAMAAGCRVDDLDLDGKRCPCVAGWTCEIATDTCVRDPVDAMADDGLPIDAPPGDGASIDAIDAPPGTSCLGTAGGAALFGDDFADLIGWVTRGGAWAATAMEAVQSDTGGSLIYAFPAGTGAFTDYRVAARARRLGGSTTGSMELSLRIQATGDGQYHCAWSAAGGALRLDWTRTNGSLGATLAQVQIDLGMIPGYDPATAVIVEAQAVGTQITCCVRDVAGASVTASDTRYTLGSPGLRTRSQSAAFDDFAVNAP